jgi:molybdate transport system substrate-binding protein
VKKSTIKSEIILLFLSICFALSLSSRALGSENDIVVFAAASTTEVVKELGQVFEKQTGFTVTTSFAGSSALAKQIREGAPASIFISANRQWLDYLAAQDLLQKGSLVVIATNRLVVIVPKDVTVTDPFNLKDLPFLLQNGFLGIGNPTHVPAGIYAKAALESLGIWNDIKDRYVQMPNERAVLAVAERGEVAAAIVYATDVQENKNVKVIATLPLSSHPEIVYGMAVIKAQDNYSAKTFFDFVRSSRGQEIFEKYGFAPIRAPEN